LPPQCLKIELPQALYKFINKRKLVRSLNGFASPFWRGPRLAGGAKRARNLGVPRWLGREWVKRMRQISFSWKR